MRRLSCRNNDQPVELKSFAHVQRDYPMPDVRGVESTAKYSQRAALTHSPEASVGSLAKARASSLSG